MNYETIIIGAGAAGLAAAQDLSRAQGEVLILEARSRAGGRIHTIYDADKVPFELGAEFVHGEPPEIIDAARVAKLELRSSNGARWEVGDDGELSKATTDDDDGENEIWQKLEEYKDDDVAFAEFLRCNFDAAKFADARQSATGYVNGFHAADVEQIGVAGLQLTENAAARIAGERNFRFPDGYQTLVENLQRDAERHGAEFRFDSIVNSIKWRRGAVEIKTGATNYQANRALITVPLGVLQAGRIEFQPALPHKQAAWQKLKMGAARRVTLRFKQKWWTPILRAKGDENLGFLFAGREPFPVWWPSEPSETPLLTAWTGGENARQFDGQTAAFVINQAVASLARIFAVEKSVVENQIVGAQTYDWQTDEFARGSYSYVPVDGLQNIAELAAPIENTLFWAGEATNNAGHWATVHGAIATGRRAAREIMKI